MREAVTTVQMVLFKVLRQSVHDRYVDQSDIYHTQLAGAVINNLFGTQPMDEGVVVFRITSYNVCYTKLLRGQLQDGFGGAVVFLELDNLGTGELLGKTHDIVKISAAETVDGLGVIADHHDVVVGMGQKAHYIRLQLVGVLIFVHQNVAKTVGKIGPSLVRFHQQLFPEDQKIVISYNFV